MITSRDIQFHEDDTLSKLAQVKVGLTQSTNKEIDKLINAAIYPESDISHQISISSDILENKIIAMLQESENSQQTFMESTLVSNLQYSELPHPSTSPQHVSSIDTLSAPCKSKKWDDLLRQAPSIYE